MSLFADRLSDAVARMGNPTVMGLDPMLEYVPDSLISRAAAKGGTPAEIAADALLAFNCRLIDATMDIVPAVKLQSAYYEMYGPPGVRAFADTIAYAGGKGMLVIADCKRNDIGSTAEAYATAYLGRTRLPGGQEAPMFGADALTVNPYFGLDGIEPFLVLCRQEGKGIYILVRTSNPSAGEFQDMELANGNRLYEHVADQVARWGAGILGRCGYSSVGAVVGATWPEQAESLRRRLPGVPFLIPGYGAQGGAAADVCAGFDATGGGALVNASRSLMCAWRKTADMDKERFDEACRAEAVRMRDEIRLALEKADNSGE
ncbi:MAG: orotidine-5'-phosphate decarboxylase [Clostridia bacterium]|nr:orotidine-5'-phosphate decarboxylase [Clostridia bacterium]